MSENRDLFLRASTTAQYVAQIVDVQLTGVGLPGYLLAILTHVRDLEPVSPTEISRRSGAPMTTLRDNVQRLVERKLIRRTANPSDGRSYLLRLTARGRTVVAESDPALLNAYLALERRLPRSRRQYERALSELNQALEETLEELASAAPVGRRRNVVQR